MRKPSSHPVAVSSPLRRPHPVTSSDFADLIGRPFRYGGRGPKDFDCYGLVLEIYRRRGIRLPEFGSSSDIETIHSSILLGRDLFTRIERPEPWCLVTFTMRPPYTSHIGIVLPDGAHFMHTMERVSVCIEQLDGLLWRRRITGYYKPREETQSA